MPRQSSLTTAKSAAVAAPPSLSSASILIASAPLAITSGASPSLVTVIGAWLADAGVPLGTDGKSFGAAFRDGLGSARSAFAPSPALVNGLKFVAPPSATGSRSEK